MITIRYATKEDAEKLCELQKAAFLPLYERYHDEGNPYLRGPEDITRRLETDIFKYFCILEDGEIVGGILYRCAGSGIFFDELKDGEYYLQRVFVDPDRQSKGIASAAILLTEKEFPDAVRFTVDFPSDLDKNRRCYEKAGYCDTGRRTTPKGGPALSCFEKTVIHTIREITKEELPSALEVIHQSFRTVAEEFSLTCENCPKHTSFLPLSHLETQMKWGRTMLGLYIDEKMIGYASLSKEADGEFELHNLAVLPEYRHNGYGAQLLARAKKEVIACGGKKIKIGIIEESQILRKWYEKHGFIHKGTRKFEHLPFTVGYMELTV